MIQDEECLVVNMQLLPYVTVIYPLWINGLAYFLVFLPVFPGIGSCLTIRYATLTDLCFSKITDINDNPNALPRGSDFKMYSFVLL